MQKLQDFASLGGTVSTTVREQALVDSWRELINRHARVTGALERALQEEHGLGVSEFEVLERLALPDKDQHRMQELGDSTGDGPAESDRIAGKLDRLRVFEDGDGKMNLSVRDVGGEVLCVSQFTLYGDVRKGNRPSFVDAAPPKQAEALYERVREALRAKGGVFGARMAVSLVNDGPVTLL